MILFGFLWSTYAKIFRGHLVGRCSERRRTHGGRRSAPAGMPARLGPWSLRAALPSVAAETPSSSPASAPSAAAPSVLEIAGERPQDPSARLTISGLPVVQIQAANQHLSDQSTSITTRLVLSGIVETGRPPPSLPVRSISYRPRRFANLHRYPEHLHPGPSDTGMLRLNNAVRSRKDLCFFHFLCAASRRI